MRDIHAYVASDNETAADRLSDRFFDVFAQLASTPGIGPAMPELGDGDLRVFPVGSYAVFYRIATRSAHEQIEIVRVIHGARDFESLF
jgi:toxin ParE1/3/4